MCSTNTSYNNLFGAELLALFDEDNFMTSSDCSRWISELETLESILMEMETLPEHLNEFEFPQELLPTAPRPSPDGHLFKTPQTFSCRHCPEKLFCPAAKRQHEMSHIKQVLRCGFCKRRTKTVSEMRRHYAYYHGGKPMKYVFIN